MSTDQLAADAFPAYLSDLVDDAAIFPPGNAPLGDAVVAHRGYRRAGYAPLVGPFVVSDLRLAELVEVATSSTTDADEPIPVSVVVTGGAGALDPAVRWATGSGVLALRALEIALRGSTRATCRTTPGGSSPRWTSCARPACSTTTSPVYVEAPRLYGEEPGHGWLTALDEIAAVDHPLKFRTGGADPDAFPAAAELATCLGEALDRELRFKCTAGLHNAVRHRDEATGFEHHGFLNVLLATRASLDGETTDEVADTLELADPDAVRARVGGCRRHVWPEPGAGSPRSARAACSSRWRTWSTSTCCRPASPRRRTREPRAHEPAGWRAPPARSTTSTTCRTACSARATPRRRPPWASGSGTGCSTSRASRPSAAQSPRTCSTPPR